MKKNLFKDAVALPKPETQISVKGYPLLSIYYGVYANTIVLNVAKEIHINEALPFGLFYKTNFFPQEGTLFAMPFKNLNHYPLKTTVKAQI